MPTSYPGDATGLNARTDTITISVPADGDDVSASITDAPSKKLANYIKMLVTYAPTKTTVTPASNWSTSVGSKAPAAYYQDVSGRVVVEGALHHTATGSGALAFTLPSGFRPTADHVFPTVDWNGSDAFVAQLEVKPDGTVTFYTENTGSNVWVSFELSFYP